LSRDYELEFRIILQYVKTLHIISRGHWGDGTEGARFITRARATGGWYKKVIIGINGQENTEQSIRTWGRKSIRGLHTQRA
jgi:hypothetical protein